MSFQPTHVSKADGSPARMSQVSDINPELCIMHNENGDCWADHVEDWQPIRKVYCAVAECEFEAVLDGKYCATHTLQLNKLTKQTWNVSEYEAERWRAMSDELTGQADRLRNLARSSGEWQAIDLIESAARSLFGAFGAIMKERAEHGN